MPSLRNWRKKRVTKSNDKKVPALRFKGFTDDWEQRKFRDIYKKSSEKNDLSYSKDQVISVATMKWSHAPSNSSDTYMKSYNVMKKGDIAFEGHVNKNYIYGRFVENTIGDGIVSHIFDVYTPLEKKHNLNFWKYYISSSKIMNHILRMSTTNARMMSNLVKADIDKQIIYIPSHLEQQQIGDILKTLTKCIDLQQRKLEYFMTIKAELLRSIFPNTGGKRGLHISDQPWKLQTMNDIFKEKNIKNEHGKLLSVSISKGIYPFSENERKNNSSNNKSNYKEVKYNDIAYNSMRMWQGALGVSKYDGIVSPAYTVITAKKQENPLFYYYYFKNKRMLFNFRQHSQGLTSDTWNLKFPLFKKIIIQTPISKKEEQIIANLFKTLDQNIIYTKTKIEKFNYIKQFLLQNMFI